MSLLLWEERQLHEAMFANVARQIWDLNPWPPSY
jgi:hypothetical protein